MVSDALSRDNHISNNILEHTLTSIFPTQTEDHFKISPNLPPEITSWIDSLIAESTRSKASHPEHYSSNLGRLLNGNISVEKAESLTLTWMDMNKMKKSASCKHLQGLLDENTLGQETHANSLEVRFRPPLHAYVCPFGRTYGLTLVWMDQDYDL